MQEEKNKKQELEELKLEIEIEELRKPWYKKPNYLQVLLPTTVAVGSLLYAIVSGLFSTKYDQFMLEQKQLKYETTVFETKRDSIKNENEIIRVKNENLHSQLLSAQLKKYGIQKSLSLVTMSLNKAKAQLAFLENEKIEYTNNISKLDSNFHNKVKVLTSDIRKLEKIKKELKTDIYDFAYSQDVLIDSLQKLQTIIVDKNHTLNNLKYEIELRKKPFKSDIKNTNHELFVLSKLQNKLQQEIKESIYIDQQDILGMNMREVERIRLAELKRIDTLTVEEMTKELDKIFNGSNKVEDKMLKPMFKTQKKN